MLELAGKNITLAVLTNYIQGHKIKYDYNKWKNMKAQQRNKIFKKDPNKNFGTESIISEYMYIQVHT